MFKFQYEVVEGNEDYTLSIYDRHGRRHFQTDISENDFQLYQKDENKFADWIEETFDDVIDTLE